MRDHYETLEVQRDATVEEIRAAYRFQLKAFHPDKFPPESADARKAQERVQRILEAYSVLSNERSRGEYDRFINYTSSPPPESISAPPARKTPKPPSRAIYISAAMDELRTARELLSTELNTLGYATVLGGPPSNQGDARHLIRKRISDCRAVVQLIGHSFGAEPPTVDPNFGRVSYVQYEGLCARQLGKPIHYLFLSDDFPINEAAEETKELRNLQSAYRRRLRIVDHPHLSQYIGSSEALRLNVRALAPQLAQATRWRIKRLWIPVAAILAIAFGVWLFPKQKTPRESVVRVPKPTVAPTAVTEKVIAAVPPPPEKVEPSASPIEVPTVAVTDPPSIKTPPDATDRYASPYLSSREFAEHAMKLREDAMRTEVPQVFAPTISRALMTQYPWKINIVTATFFIGERVQGKQRKESAWDPDWLKNYGGADPPEQSQRRDYIPTSFVPRQNPFYCALPYNDVIANKLKPEAPLVIPWFKQAFTGDGYSVCRGRWLAIRKGNKTAFAQWEDAGPFRTDHYQYVFQNERPTPNPKRGAGLSVSPAVRDYLDLDSIDVTDWQFVEVRDVPPGPWRTYGDNNHFVIAKRQAEHHGEFKSSKKQDKDQRDSVRIRDFEASVQTQAAWEKEAKGEYAEAIKLYQAPVAHGNRYALTNLAKLYLLGKGVPRDETKAQALLEKAATQGHEEAQQMLDSFFPNRSASVATPTPNESRPSSTPAVLGPEKTAVAVSAPRPEYPLAARRSRITGSGVCVMTIDTKSGAVTSATMAQSTGNALLDHAATTAFRQWRFKPGSPPKVRMPVTFSMSGVRY